MSYIYIAGRGRSGSTILDLLLGNSSEIESVGELMGGLSRVHREMCGCGTTVPNCPFWQEVEKLLINQGLTLGQIGSMLVHGPVALFYAWLANPHGDEVATRVKMLEAIENAITTCAGKPHMLDSGKSPAHALLLLRYLPSSRLIHLVRDPRDVMRSHLDKIQRGSHAAIMNRYGIFGRSPWLFLLWQAASWTFSNMTCEALSLLYRGRVARVRFEDLRTRPVEVLEYLGQTLGVDLSVPILKVTCDHELTVGHNVGGNQIRRGRVWFRPDGVGTRPPLPKPLELAALLLCGPLMLWYGYKWTSKAALSVLPGETRVS